MDGANQAWDWLGREVIDFGARWLWVALIVLVSGGWFGWRYRSMKRRVDTLEANRKREERRVDELFRAMPQMGIRAYSGSSASQAIEGDINRNVSVTEAQYKASKKDRKTIYLISEKSAKKPIDLVRMIEGMTSIQAAAIMKTYIGSSLSVNALVHDVEDKGDYIQVYARDDDADIYFEFNKKALVDEVKNFRRGDEIKAFGRLNHIAEYGIRLERCELL